LTLKPPLLAGKWSVEERGFGGEVGPPLPRERGVWGKRDKLQFLNLIYPTTFLNFHNPLFRFGAEPERALVQQEKWRYPKVFFEKGLHSQVNRSYIIPLPRAGRFLINSHFITCLIEENFITILFPLELNLWRKEPF